MLTGKMGSFAFVYPVQAARFSATRTIRLHSACFHSPIQRPAINRKGAAKFSPRSLAFH